VGLAAGGNAELLMQQTMRYRPGSHQPSRRHKSK
jgi:hypothetical protein